MKLSIVTPSYNQGRFIQATIDSVFSQNYKDLEYIVMDGGSTDLTVDILRTYGKAIQWVSEKDDGQADAVNKGILRATGDVIGWINSDDVYYPGAFQAVMDVFENHPEVNVLYGHADHINADGSYREDYYTEPWNYERLKEICYICQPSVFFRRETVVKHGLLDKNRQYAMDYDLWLRMGKTETFYFLNRKLAGSRLYEDNKTLGSVEKVHIDIMDTLMADVGYVPGRWIEGSAHSVTRAHGYKVESDAEYLKYKRHVLYLIRQYTDKYHHNPTDELENYPYRYQALKIGIDISSTLPSGGAGVAYYTKSVTEHLAEIPTDNRFLLYPVFHKCYPVDCLKNGVRIRKPNFTRLFDGPIPLSDSYADRIFSSENEKELLEFLGYPDVVFCPSFRFSKKLAKVTATVYFIHDVSFLENHEYSTNENYEVCFSGMFDAALYADMFVANSEYSKKSFLKYFPFVEEDRIRVTPLSYRSCFVQDINCEKELSSLKLDSRKPFWLFVGSIEPRKNLISLIRAYAELKKRGETFPLYIAGGKGWLNSEIFAEVKNLELTEDVKFLGYVTDEQLTALYRSCYAFVYPSWYEGFGLPILEAMVAGAPVISSRTTSMFEVGGSCVMYIDPADVPGIADAMMCLQHDKARRDELAQMGQSRAVARFSWDHCAKDTYKVFYDAIVYHEKRLTT